MKKEKLPYPRYDDCPKCNGTGLVIVGWELAIECPACWRRAHEEGDADSYNPL